jgi:hypothetical protein
MKATTPVAVLLMPLDSESQTCAPRGQTAKLITFFSDQIRSAPPSPQVTPCR